MHDAMWGRSRGGKRIPVRRSVAQRGLFEHGVLFAFNILRKRRARLVPEVTLIDPAGYCVRYQ